MARNRWSFISVILTAGVLISALMLGACASQAPSAQSGSATDYTSLVDQLRSEGATVTEVGSLTQPFFEPQAQVISVNGQDVEVFEFADASQADSAANLVSAAGTTIGNQAVEFAGPPHFYKSGKLIVLYVGSDQDVMGLLSSALGPQFAGAS